MNRALPSSLVLVVALTGVPSVALADTPYPPPTAAPAPTRQTVALASAGIALAAATAATVFGVLALQNKSDFQSSATYGRADDGNNDAAYADGAIALAVVAGVTSLVLFLTHDGGTPAARAALSASPFVVAHGDGAGAVLRF